MTTTSVLPGPRTTAVLLVTAPLLELVETLLSPLGDGSTSSELGHIAAHQGRFALSVLSGVTAVVLFTPMFLGLAEACVAKAPRASRTGAWLAVVSMGGFMAVRGIQAIELQAVDDGLDQHTAAALVDHVASNPIGAAALVMFLGGTVLGILTLAVAAWRAGLPRPAVILLALFPIVDNATVGHVGTVAAHAMLLIALGWFAVSLWPAASADRARESEALVAGSV